MKITAEDIIGASFSPHTGKEADESSIQEPKGPLVLTGPDGSDIGEALISGDFETDDPFVQLLCEVIADTLLANQAEMVPDLEEI